jgi:prepilin-type processing-associated H-X9-DG protein
MQSSDLSEIIARCLTLKNLKMKFSSFYHKSLKYLADNFCYLKLIGIFSADLSSAKNFLFFDTHVTRLICLWMNVNNF